MPKGARLLRLLKIDQFYFCSAICEIFLRNLDFTAQAIEQSQPPTRKSVIFLGVTRCRVDEITDLLCRVTQNHQDAILR